MRNTKLHENYILLLLITDWKDSTFRSQVLFTFSEYFNERLIMAKRCVDEILNETFRKTQNGHNYVQHYSKEHYNFIEQ